MNLKHLLAAILLSAVCLTPAMAEITSLVWNATEIVDSPVGAISTGSSASVVNWQGEWWIVYVKNGDVTCARRSADGWTAPVTLSQGRPAARNPHLAPIASSLWVCWQDERSGHPEVYARQRVGGLWMPDQCLSCDDALASSYPAISGHSSGQAFAAWEDSVSGSFRVLGRHFANGSWGVVMEISTSPANGRDPSVAFDLYTGDLIVAWADFRGGIAQIYSRVALDGTEWEPETRWFAQPASCRHPSVTSSSQIYVGPPYRAPVVSYEAPAPSGTPEVWFKGYQCTNVTRVSPDDGIPSIQPNTGTFAFPSTNCQYTESFYEGPSAFVTWTDHPATGARTHGLAGHVSCTNDPENDLLVGVGLSGSAVGVIEGDPRAGLLQIWVEERAGAPALVAREGSVVGCFDQQIAGPPSLLIAPEGIPGNIIRLVDRCSGNGVGGFLSLSLDTVDAELTWDPIQQHPYVEGYADDQGNADFSLRGGGCAQGEVDARCFLWGGYSWPGVKSPDVDGNCRVQTADLQYVQSRLGTSDFCADLDGSGAVDAVDVAIVEATMGDHCSNVSGVDASGTTRPMFTTRPNPCTDDVVLRLTASDPGDWAVRVYDGAGRLVRDLGGWAVPSGLNLVTWDLTDGSGRRLPMGVYFAVARSEGATLRHPILIIR